jgi:hypothetical protein
MKKYTIFASRETESKRSSKELQRFETPNDANSDALAQAYIDELQDQGWTIRDVWNVQGQPIQTRRKTQR